MDHAQQMKGTTLQRILQAAREELKGERGFYPRSLIREFAGTILFGVVAVIAALIFGLLGMKLAAFGALGCFGIAIMGVSFLIGHAERLEPKE